MDENSFVDYLKAAFPFRRGSGIGDDCSIVEIDSGFQLISKDILIEDVHFDASFYTPEEIAVRALGVNLSDIAAMGGEPEYFYLGLGFPEGFRGEKLHRFFSALKQACDRWNIDLAGGDISSSPASLFISVTMVGRSGNPVRRDGANAGDLIGISRGTGESAAGLELLKKGIDIPYFTKKHKDPEPEIEKGLVLSRYVNAMIDVSDGLMIDLGRMLSASGKGGRIEYTAIPVSDDMKNVCRKHNLNETGLVLSGGEDFALLFAVSPENRKKLENTGTGFHIIGEVSEDRDVHAEYRGALLELQKSGYDHFR